MPVLPAIIGAAGMGINAISQGHQNRKNRAFSRGMYDLQRQHALEDFDRVNEYNSPLQQVERLKEAGLNKALMYGKSASPGLAGSVRSSDYKNPDTQTPQYGGSLTYLPQMFDFRVKQAQADNLDTQRRTEAQRALLLAAETDSKTTDAEIKRATKMTAIATAEAEQSKIEADTKFQLDENERRAALQAPTLLGKLLAVNTEKLKQAKTKEETKNLKEQRKLIKAQTNIRQIEAGLNESGVFKNDGLLARWIARLLDEQGGPLELKRKLEGYLNIK